MELVKSFTTKQPPLGTTVSTLQKNITIYVLLTGIAGGLLLILTILLLCKYCSSTSPCRSATTSTSNKNKSKSAGGCKVEYSLSSHGHLSASGTDSSEQETAFKENRSGELITSGSSASRTGQTETTAKAHRSGKHSSSASTAANLSAANPLLNPHMDGKDVQIRASVDLADSCVIQVEPIRVIAATPIDDSWPSASGGSVESRDLPILSGGCAVDREDSWNTRHSLSPSQSGSTYSRTRKSSAEAPVIAVPAAESCQVSCKRNLRHAASHPSTRDPDSSVSKRRMDWRNSHRNFRSTPNSTASRESQSVTYEARRALRDYLTVEHHSPAPASGRSQPPPLRRSPTDRSEVEPPAASQRMQPKRGGSMREYISDRTSGCQSQTCQPFRWSKVNSFPANPLPSRESPSCKRWRCHTVDCPCALPAKELESALTVHRHSFPGGDNPRDELTSHHCQVQVGLATKPSPYNSLWRSESLDWAGFHPKEDPESADGQGPSVHPGSRITIRYNDPGSFESVHEDSMVFCFEAGTKKEFRQRLQKTIHAQYREVWELRASLEEHGDFSDLPSSPEPESAADIEMPVIHSISFDSTEDLDEDFPPLGRNYDGNPAAMGATSTDPVKLGANLLCPSSAMKRQSYRNTLDSRHGKATGFNAMQTLTSPGTNRSATTGEPFGLVAATGAAGAAQSSFDSIDTIETSASSTDVSRLDHVTTSFESSATADTTTTDEAAGMGADPPSGSTSCGSHRWMLASRGDSGYRSLETAPMARRPAMLTKTLATTLSIDEDETDEHPEAESNQCQCRSDVHDDKCERNKPVIFARCTRYGLAKSRSMSATGTSSTVPLSNAHSGAASGKIAGWKNRMAPMLARDYSIDERTDALFREFSRCDPVYDSRTHSEGRKDHPPAHMRQVSSSFNKRWHQRHEQRRRIFNSLQYDHPAQDSSDNLLHCSLKE